MEKKFIPNDVYKFSVTVNLGKGVTVYTHRDAFKGEDKEEQVLQKYFTQERIDALKKELLEKLKKKFEEESNPFSIYCCDLDGDYNVTEDQIFKG